MHKTARIAVQETREVTNIFCQQNNLQFSAKRARTEARTHTYTHTNSYLFLVNKDFITKAGIYTAQNKKTQ